MVTRVGSSRPVMSYVVLWAAPTRPEAGAWVVVIAGPAGVTLTGSASHLEASALFLWLHSFPTRRSSDLTELIVVPLGVSKVPLPVTLASSSASGVPLHSPLS